MPTITTPLNPGKAGAKTGHPCRACALPHKILETVDSKLRMGEKARHVHTWLRKNFPTEAARVSYDILASHNRRHVRLIDRAAGRLSDAQRMRRERIDLSKAVLAGEVDPQAYFGPAALAADLQKTSARLDLAADEAFVDGEHSALAALSNSLLRAVEIRGKLGGSIADRTELNVTVSLSDLHARLDGILVRPGADRQLAARDLLGLPTPSSASGLDGGVDGIAAGVDGDASSPEFARTIEADPAPVGGLDLRADPPPVRAERKASRRTD